MMMMIKSRITEGDVLLEYLCLFTEKEETNSIGVLANMVHCTCSGQSQPFFLGFFSIKKNGLISSSWLRVSVSYSLRCCFVLICFRWRFEWIFLFAWNAKRHLFAKNSPPTYEMKRRRTRRRRIRIFYLLEMDVLRVHLHRSCSGPLKWHSLSQFSSSEKQPEWKRVKLNIIRINIGRM